MAKKETVSNEAVVAAIISNGTIAKAADSCGLAPRTVYDRMRDKEFKALYNQAKAEVIRGAVYNLNAQLSAAVDVIREIMENQDNSPAVRLQAAQTILNNAGKLSNRLQDEEGAALPPDPVMLKLDKELEDLW